MPKTQPLRIPLAEVSANSNTVLPSVESNEKKESKATTKKQVQVNKKADARKEKPKPKSLDEKREDWRRVNRETLNCLKAAANLSSKQIQYVESEILFKHSKSQSSKEKPEIALTIEEVDNVFVRRTLPEWITMNVPHNKQWKVREAISATLWSLTPPATQSRERSSEYAYRSGSMEPPGYKHICPSDYGSDKEKEKRKPKRKAGKKRAPNFIGVERQFKKRKSY